MTDADRKKIVRFLKQESLFGSVSRPVLERLAALAHIERVARGNRLFSMGQPCKQLHFLMEGQARVALLSKDGRERILHIVLPGDMVGAVPFFDGQDYPCTVVAEEDCSFAAFHRHDFLKLLQKEVQVTLGILGGLVERQREIVGHLEEISFEDTSSRLWHYLMDHSLPAKDTFPRVFDPLPTREQIAGSIGTVREVVSRRLSWLIKTGYIRIDGRRLILLRPLE